MNSDQVAYLDLLKKTLTASVYDQSAWRLLEPEKPRAGSPVKWVRQQFKNWLIRTLRKRSILLVDRIAFDASKRTAGKDWPLFGYTMVGHRRLDNIQSCIEDVLENRVPGDFIETGAWQGGSAIFMRALLKVHGVTDRKVWVADSFEGMPSPADAKDGWDLSGVDYLKVSLERVRSNFEKFGLLDDQVVFLKGWFRDTLPQAPIRSLAILRLDGDLYQSTMDSLTSLYPKVSKGGYVIIDDYYSWPSCRQAVTDFLAGQSVRPEIKAIDADGAYWQRA
jgi:O-methyltransferase